MKQQAHETGDDEDYHPVFKAVCVEAMQIALEYDGAPARCPAQKCRKIGRCHAKAVGDRPVCRAGIPGHVAMSAALMVMFLSPPGMFEDGLGGRLVGSPPRETS